MIFMNPQALRRFAQSGRCQFFGGSSSSSQSTSNTDARVVGGDGSINSSLNVSGSGNNITTTDFGAVNQSLSLAMQGIEAANVTARQSAASSGHLLEGALQMVGDQSTQHAASLEAIKTGDTRTIVLAGFAVAGLAVVALINKSKG